MAWASTYTSLSLDRYAEIMGINPVHFQAAAGPAIWPVKQNRCSDLWPQYSWQDADRVSREDLARIIDEVEQEFADYLGYFPGPRWVSQEVQDFPQYYRRDMYRRGGRDVRGMRVGIPTGRGKVISPGIRDVDIVGTATEAGLTLVYTDADGDGYEETATITLPTSLTSPFEIKPYFAGHNGEQEWEIRPVRSVSIVGPDVVIVLWAWQLINPTLQTGFPTSADFTAIVITDTATRVTSVDVYREYTNTETRSAVFYWEPNPPFTNIFCTTCGGAGCPACVLTTQDGCVHIRDAEHGIVVPTPATYSDSDAAWSADTYSVRRDPDMVKVYYKSGHLSEGWLRGTNADPLERRFANAIAWMATARLERPFCSCANVTALAIKYQVDLALSSKEGSFFVPESLMSNPFGTRMGEVMAYRVLSKLSGTTRRRVRGAVA